MFLLYNLLLTLLSPFWVPWMYYRTRKRGEQPNWSERFGNIIVPKATHPRLWLHAVSVGEVVAALPILKELRQLTPDIDIVLSTTTSSGHQTAEDLTGNLVNHVVYFPIDVVRFQVSAMARVKPNVVALMETELWMNFLWSAKAIGADTFLINGRISDRSFPRSIRAKAFYKALLAKLDLALMQTAVDAKRIVALGARTVEVLGNCKFDQAVEDASTDPEEWRLKLGLPEKPIVVVGSSRDGNEEDFVLDAIAQIGLGRIAVLHAPRHLERVAELGEKVAKRFGSVAFRSKQERGDYVILDTYGELSSAYSVASVVIIGGGFSNHGGQNLLQPLAHGKPVIHGPHMQNFADIAEAARKVGCAIECSTSDELASSLRLLLDDNAKRQDMSEAALEFIQKNRGASRRYAEKLLQALRTP